MQKMKTNIPSILSARRKSVSVAFIALVVSTLLLTLIYWRLTDTEQREDPKKSNKDNCIECYTDKSNAGTISDIDTSYTKNNITQLIDSFMFQMQGIKLKWISMRMRRLASMWESTRDDLLKKSPELFSHPKHILLFPGLLSEYSTYDFAENAFEGGYLGELTQWSDLLAVLHMLGHKVVIATSKELVLKSSPERIDYDLLFTDYIGMNGIFDAGLIGKYKCRIRLLDSFGTEPKFSFQTKTFLADKNGEDYTNWNFENTRQFWTLYPHTPDNSFLGFAMQKPLHSIPHSQRKKQAVIYGKEAYYYDGQESYLKAVASEVELHNTLKLNVNLEGMPHIVKHGILSQKDVIQLLQESRLFIGLGLPYEGPGALEALANGCVFIQPKFKPPRNKYNEGYFDGKPTERAYTSQVPYLEKFVGEPYVYTVDSKKDDEVRAAVRKALKTANFSSFLPYEFTQKGMMERIGNYIVHQNFCEPISISQGKNAIARTSIYPPDGAVDGNHTDSSCYSSMKSINHKWWMVDLGEAQIIGRIKVTLAYDWLFGRELNVCSNSYRVSLLDSMRNTLLLRDYHDCRLVYEWKGVDTLAQYVKVETLNEKVESQLILCSVEVFPYQSMSLLSWAHWKDLHTVITNPGQNCRDACLENKMICEPDYFPYLNTHNSVINHLGCTVTTTLQEQYADYAPALAVVNDDNLLVKSGQCIITDLHNLLGCPGHSDKYRRLCPCRTIVKGQIALPQ